MLYGPRVLHILPLASLNKSTQPINQESEEGEYFEICLGLGFQLFLGGNGVGTFGSNFKGTKIWKIPVDLCAGFANQYSPRKLKESVNVGQL